MSIGVLPPDQVANQFRAIADGLDSRLVTKGIKQSAAAIKQDVRDHFDSSSDPEGRIWAPLRHPRPRGGNRPLLDTGLLRASTTGPGQHHIEQLTDNSFIMGTALPYAQIHQEGGTIHPVHARALAIPLTVEAERVGSPRQFPRRLVMLWRPGADSGCLAEIDQARRRTTARERSLTRSIRRYTPAQRGILKKIKRLTALAKKTKNVARQARYEGQIRIQYLKLRKLQHATGTQTRQRTELRRQRQSRGIRVQYALVQSVQIPARPFLGFGQQLIGRLETILQRIAQAAFGGSGGSNAG